MRCEHCGEELQEDFAFCPSCGEATRREPPSLLGERYLLRRKLGAGGYGVVYEAQDLQASRLVAVKLLHEHKKSAHDALARFLREARISLTLRHPNIVEAYELGESNHQMWLVMERLEGETLAKHLEKNAPLPWIETLSLMGPLCAGLDEAHRHGVVHRDLKPSNIILARTSQQLTPKLLDFGMATFREAATLTLSSVVSGTPKYMAPEQWNGLKHAGPPADIYALAVIFYYALSKRFPFEADTPMSWMKRHSVDPPLDLGVAMGDRHIPSGARQVIMRALSKVPTERPRTATELFTEVVESFSGGSTESPLITQKPSDTIIEDTTQTLSDLVIVQRPKK